MRISLLAPSAPFPIGGNIALYEFANALARRGNSVKLLHVKAFNQRIDSIKQLSWFSFDDRIDHWIMDSDFDHRKLSAADLISAYLPEAPSKSGQPFVFVQGHGLLKHFETESFHYPCLKICVARWLLEIGLEAGVNPRQLAYVPLGLSHDKYQLINPIPDRPRQITFCYGRARIKRHDIALKVLFRLKQQIPDLRVVAFSATKPEQPLPPWVQFHLDPNQSTIVKDIYNNSRVFLCTSHYEGFGMPSIESMACGAALVTTNNGGSREFALHGKTALVAEPENVDSLVEHAKCLLLDDARRDAIVAAALSKVKEFDWDRSGERLEGELTQLLLKA